MADKRVLAARQAAALESHQETLDDILASLAAIREKLDRLLAIGDAATSELGELEAGPILDLDALAEKIAAGLGARQKGGRA